MGKRPDRRKGSFIIYIPNPGDIILLQFNPQTGHEQKGTRPAVVVSNKTYNTFTKIAVVCPITNTKRDFPLHVTLDKKTKTTGVVMCEQLKALDVQARNIRFIERMPHALFAEVLDIIQGFFENE